MEVGDKILTVKQLLRLSLILGGFGTFILIFGGAMRGLGSVMILTAILFWLYKYMIKKSALKFQKDIMVRFEIGTKED